jgi:glycosyltransferase involved in cell wall biosynthesis
VRLDPLPPQVHFTGYVSDEQLPALYSGALALVYPSLYEGFGLPPLEAMACGTPVVTSNGTSLPEIAGDAAVLVDPEDVDSIAEGILRVVSSSALRDNLRRLGLDRASRATWESTAQQTLQLLLDQAKS